MKRRPSAASFLCARLAGICDRGFRCMTRARERSANFQQDLSRLIAWRPIFSERNILSGRYFVNRPESRNAARASKHQNPGDGRIAHFRSEEHTSELQSLMRISYAVFCLKKKKKKTT